ncbi:MAG: hypothetical protein ACTSXT_11775 [Candidatus Helarchaeota archaeon]
MTEIKVNQILSDEGFFVTSQYPFVDDKILRSIDFYSNYVVYEIPIGERKLFDKPLSQCQLYIECKNSKNPCVFSLKMSSILEYEHYLIN